MLMRGFRTGRIVDSLRVLALKVLGENRMDSAAMIMIRIPMMMIGFGMDMEERDHEHPRGQPKHGKYTNSRHAQHLSLFNLCNLRRNLAYTTWGIGASINAFASCRSRESRARTSAWWSCHMFRYERKGSGPPETSLLC
jgi:hypothetical protein